MSSSLMRHEDWTLIGLIASGYPREEIEKSPRRKFILLGKWCLEYPLTSVSYPANVEILRYHWLDPQKFSQDLQSLSSLSDRILETMVPLLNDLHATSLSFRAWKIRIGPWLSMFLVVAFDRWEVLRSAGVSDNCELLCSTDELDPKPPYGFADAQEAYMSTEWNDAFFRHVFEFCKSQALRDEFDCCESKLNEHAREAPGVAPFHEQGKIKTPVISIKGSGIGRASEAFLTMSLGSLPRRRRQITTSETEEFSKWRSAPVAFDVQSDFENFVSRSLLRFLPVAYVEGQGELDWSARVSGRPSVLFAGPAIYGDERLKVEASKLVDQGGKLVITQHGGFYGQSLFSGSEDHEVAISDLFLTWGWRSCQTNVVDLGVTKPWKRVRRPRGKVMVVLGSSPRYAYQLNLFPQADLATEYFMDQLAFLASLEDGVRNSVVLRPYHRDYGWSEASFFKTHFPEVGVDSRSKFDDALKRTALVVSTYNATTYLESMYRGIPTVIFWRPNQYPLRVESSHFFEGLKSAGIFFDNPEEAAEAVNDLDGDYLDWWRSPYVQETIVDFLHEYARPIQGRLRALRSILRDQAKEHGFRSSC